MKTILCSHISWIFLFLSIGYVYDFIRTHLFQKNRSNTKIYDIQYQQMHRHLCVTIDVLDWHEPNMLLPHYQHISFFCVVYWKYLYKHLLPPQTREKFDVLICIHTFWWARNRHFQNLHDKKGYADEEKVLCIVKYSSNRIRKKNVENMYMG